MSNYIKELEKQNEELKDTLSDTQHDYIPQWCHREEKVWLYETPYVTFAIVRNMTNRKNENNWYVSFFGKDMESINYNEIDKAKKFVEDRLWKAKFFKTVIKS